MGEMADELIDRILDGYDYLDNEDERHWRETRCRHCGKSRGLFWVDTETGWRLYQYDGKNTTPHRCNRGLTPAKIISNFDDLT
jgi:hypothetical protein